MEEIIITITGPIVGGVTRTFGTTRSMYITHPMYVAITIARVHGPGIDSAIVGGGSIEIGGRGTRIITRPTLGTSPRYIG